MDFVSAVKNDAFGPILTYIIPGAVATAPYIGVVASYFEQVNNFGKQHPASFTIVATLVVILAGALLEEIGTRVELFWDRLIPNPNWERYLKLHLKDDVIGQRYLRRILIRMKFELSLVAAMPITI